MAAQVYAHTTVRRESPERATVTIRHETEETPAVLITITEVT